MNLDGHFDLSEVYTELNEKYFKKKLDLSIEWFGDAERVAKRRRTLGAYDHRSKKIRIHRILDSPLVPRYFFSFVIFHEMLHSVFPPKKTFWMRKWKIHHKAFKDAEKGFHEYFLAKTWEKNNRNFFFN